MHDDLPQLTDEARTLAMVLAAVVRNAMEDFHIAHLSDRQMRALNPIIRNAIATGLHAFDHCDRVGAAQCCIDYHIKRIPSYWEPPELLEGYVDMWKRDASGESAASGGR